MVTKLKIQVEVKQLEAPKVYITVKQKNYTLYK